ncbi:MAG: hypothetical protein V7609_2766 [Verrucomicrobiota bacterium]
MSEPISQEKLLQLLGSDQTPTAEEFRELIVRTDSHRVLAKVFLLEGTPHVFAKSPMKYVIFREQVADRFGVGSQDVCIVGSAKLGFSPSPFKFGTPFSQTSDVDVVIISQPLFYDGSRQLFTELNRMGPSVSEVMPFLGRGHTGADHRPTVDLEDWRDIKDALRNFVFENFNPGLLPDYHYLRNEIFDKIGSTSGLFLALEPKVFVSKIRARIFRTWKAAEEFYGYTLRQAKSSLIHQRPENIAPETLDDDEIPAAPGANGSQSEVRGLDVTCDQCKHVTPVWISPESDPIARFCTCGNRMMIQGDGAVTEQRMTTLAPASSVHHSFGRYYLVCPEHGGSSRSFLRADGRLFAVCAAGQHLIYRDEVSSTRREEEE